MKTRLAVAGVLLAIAIPILCLSDYIIYPIALAVLDVIAVWELLHATGYSRCFTVVIPSYAIAAAMPVLCYGITTTDGAMHFLISLSTVVIMFMIYLLGYAVIRRGAIKLADLCLFYVYFVYVVLAFTSLSLVRYIPNGVYYFLLIPLTSWICDSFAYFVGRAIGKHKLIPEVSPKKTVEGLVGGVFFTTLVTVIYGIILHFIEDAPNPNYLLLGLLGFALAVISQMGDLSASLLKREKGLKDFGTIFPGHGGVLDRFDSLLPVAPVLLVVCMLISPLT